MTPPGAATLGGAPPPAASPPDPAGLGAGLLAWHSVCGRDLPWRRSTDPWQVWVSEVMLQQTPVARVLSAYHAFLARFPSVGALAAAPLADALREWGTLGYPRRARDLWRAARLVQAESGGRIPSTVAELRLLPGVGPYSAAAIAAFGFDDQSAVPVDTNVARVVRRVCFPPSAEPPPAAVRSAAERIGAGPVVFHALMDLGATLCRARHAACSQCPLADRCASAGVDPPPAAPGRRRQAPFAGSRRQARGQVLAALRRAELGGLRADGFDAGILADLAGEGLVEVEAGSLRLPGAPVSHAG